MSTEHIELMRWIDLPTDAVWLIPPRLADWETLALRRLRERAPEQPDTVWICSSGTSSVGTLKCLGLSRAAILASAAAVNSHLAATERDRWLVAIPTFHVGGFAIAARAHLAGAAIDVAPPWSAPAFRGFCAKSETTLTSLVPTQIHDLVAARLTAPPSLRAIVVGGGALDRRLYLRARALGWPVLPSYGLTETASQIATASLASRADQYPDLTVLPHAEIELREGRVRVRGASLAHARAVIDREGRVTIDDPREDGWLVTEDLGQWTEAGLLRILGRRDDVVKILGSLVALPRVEADLGEALGANVVVLSVPEPRRGADLIAVTDHPGSLDALDGALIAYNAAVPGPRRVDRLCWTPEIPRTALGKVRRAALREALGLS